MPSIVKNTEIFLYKSLVSSGRDRVLDHLGYSDLEYLIAKRYIYIKTTFLILMVKMVLVIDLFSGLGGFSQAFLDRGHEVIRYEYNAEFGNIPNTILKDVWELTSEDLKDSEIILASPPCNHFCIPAVRYHWTREGPTEETQVQIELVKHTIKIIKEAKPKYWMLENPRAMLRTIIGKPAYTTFWAAWGLPFYKPTDIWGDLPPIDRKLPHKWEKAPRGSNKGIQNSKISSEVRAKIPYDFSMAICLAVEGKSAQRTLEEFETEK